MLLLRHNKDKISSQDLIQVERQYLRWMEGSFDTESLDLNVLDCELTDLFGILLGIFTRLDILNTLDITASELLDFLVDVHQTYEKTPYHSFFHATDVVIVMNYIMEELGAKKYFDNMELTIIFFAAICHDAGHTGYNNDYHVKLKTELATRFNNTSVLESLSIEIGKELLKKHEFKFDQDTHLPSFEKLILSTDMTYHYDLQNEARDLEDVLSSVNLWGDDLSETLSINNNPHIASSLQAYHQQQQKGEEEEEFESPLNHKQTLSLACTLLHGADISNTVRSWPISKQWSDLVVQEFFRQGDAEKDAGLDISAGMDRSMATQPSISIKFGDFIAKPYFEALAGLLPKAQVFLDVMQENREEWVKLKSSPLSTSITHYFESSLASRLSISPNKQPGLTRNVSVPAGTVALPMDDLSFSPPLSTTSSSSSVKPMPIVRAMSHASVLLPTPQSSVSSEFRRSSFDYRREQEQV